MAKRSYKPVAWEGEKYRLPRISKGRDLSKEEKIEIATLVCNIYASDRHTLNEALAYCGIRSDSTWYIWLKEIKEIEPLYIEAQKLKDTRYKTRLRERARTMAERLIEGYTFTVQEIEETPAKPGADDKEPALSVITKIKQKTIIVKPSVRLIETILFNFDGHNFTRNPEPYKAGNEALPTDIKVEIVGGNIPPVTSEDDIKTDI